MDPTNEKETFKDFRNSLKYGSRNDLNFKFLAQMDDEAGYAFFGELLSKLSLSLDDGNFERILEHVVEGQIHAYFQQEQFAYETGPFSAMKKPLSDSKLLLLTSSGHFVEGDDPEPLGVKHMTQEEAIARIGEFMKEPPILSRIPKTTPLENLKVRHGGYDIHGSQMDANVAFPLSILLEAEQAGTIGELCEDAFSFNGACSQMRLLKKTGPEWVEMIQEKQVDAVLLVPV